MMVALRGFAVGLGGTLYGISWPPFPLADETVSQDGSDDAADQPQIGAVASRPALPAEPL